MRHMPTCEIVGREIVMSSQIVGLDYPAALALAPAGSDGEAMKYLLMQAESGMMAGLAEAQDNPTDGDR